MKKADEVSAEGVSIFTRGGRWRSDNNMNACIITNSCHKGNVHDMKRGGASETSGLSQESWEGADCGRCGFLSAQLMLHLLGQAPRSAQ